MTAAPAAAALAVICVPTAAQAGEVAAGRILDLLAARGGEDLLIACPAGRTPATTYAALARWASVEHLDLSGLVVVMVDEYVVEDARGRPVLCEPTAHFSCRRFVHEHLIGPANAGLPTSHGIAPDRIWCPDPSDPGALDERVQAAGGIGLFLLASGASDGHVAFNPPGTTLDSGARVVALAESTRRDNLSTFPGFDGIDAVPTLGVSLGLRTVVDAGEVLALLLGADKRAAHARLTTTSGFDPAWPATVVHACHAATLLVDELAAGRS